MSWLEKSAKQGFPEAQSELGRKYMNGEGVPKNYVLSVAWLRKAAEQGDPQGQALLAIAYHMGKGVPKDDVRAYAWYNLRAAQGDEAAGKIRDFLSETMTPAQVAEAQKLSRELF